MKVDFIILGAMKCGTSSLATILSLHPDISFSKPKEPHFFSRNINWRHGLEEYHSHFPKNGILYGEGSTSYTKYPAYNLHIWDDIYEYNNNMKFVYVIRNPIARTVSQYVHLYQLGHIDTSLEETVLRNPDIINFSRYYTQVIPYIRKFGRENVMILLFEDFIKNQEAVTKNILSFLGADVSAMPEITDSIHSNKTYEGRMERPHSKYKGKLFPKLIQRISPAVWRKMYVPTNRYFTEKPVLSEDLKRVIINMLELDILAMQDLIGRDLSDWLVLNTYETAVEG
ncbi:sulfotransferase domain-containing protein [Ilyomonas limi]|uniref:Sulfotransferase domain-containing protein n=1 Tax=Ilyomonas limi TaxID=2575867 RepID=A0A4U3KZ96_9BACT|nr:sulfotransferase domain-containing protein [Ilyomonas limi]TKK67985.1 sulfotransferase domain-containing protein [Ilyomonas limi]